MIIHRYVDEPLDVWIGRLCMHIDQLERYLELESLRNDHMEAELKELRIGMEEIGVIRGKEG